MIKTLYPFKDATLYQSSESINTGKDAILEVNKYVSSSFGPLTVTRPILQFNTSTLSASLAAQSITTAAAGGGLKWYLKLFISQEEDVQLEYTLVTHPLRSAWSNGVGKSTHNPITTAGASWKYLDNTTTGTQWTDAGGYFYSGSHASESAIQTFVDVRGDIEIDITDIVQSWHTAFHTNYGILLKRSGSQETDSSIQGNLYYYSRNTNTIYSPRLEARYDNATHAFTTTTGTEIIISDEVDVQPRLRPQYKQNSQERIFIDTTIKGGARTQAGSIGAISRHYLPQSSSYAIIDNATGEYVYKHDTDATYVGRTGNTQNYIDIDMYGLFPERYYALEFRVNLYDGTNEIASRYYKSNTLFKVVK